MSALLESKLRSLPLLSRGKVRDIYAVGDDKLLMITTDRLSAFDVIMSSPIPDKGVVLNRLTDFWFARLGHIVPNHLTGIGCGRIRGRPGARPRGGGQAAAPNTG
jgi:phosphoribosylaminoimidazole-succinocarboxamide synthase